MSNALNFVFLTVLSTLLAHISASDLARGFNEKIDWVNLEDGLQLAKEQEKPIMMLIHKSWCGACKALAPKFSESAEIEELSRSFVMINILDEEEPEDKKYYPDGGYIPRVLFLDKTGDVQDDLYNDNGSKDYKYYFPDPNDILVTMKKALAKQQTDKQVMDEL